MRTLLLSCSSLVVVSLACGEDAVTQANRPPALQVPGPQLVVEGSLVSFTVSALDLDDDPVTVAASGLPENASFTAGRFEWVPTHLQAGSYNVTFTADDGRLKAQASVGIAVVDYNRAPSLDGVSDISAREGLLVSMVVRGSDADGDAVKLAAEQLPRGAAFDASEGLFTWTPGYDQAGSYTVVFTGNDQHAPAPLFARATAVVMVNNYAELLPATNFFIEGTPNNDLTRTTDVLLDFTAETDLAPDISEMKVSNLPTMGDAAWQPFAARVPWILTPGDGEKLVYARFRNANEFVSNRVEGRIELDQTPPYPASAALIGPAVTREPTVQLALVAVDTNGLHLTEALTVSEDPGFDGATAAAFPSSGKVTVALSAGEGPKQLFVRFRDVAGNDAVVSVPVTRDTLAPSGGSLLVRSPTNNDFTSSVSVTLQLSAPADATHVLLGAAGAPDACSDGDLAGKTPTPVAGTLPFLLPAGDGPKRVCAKLLDAAGNGGAPFGDDIVLDTVLPTAPLIVTQSAIVNLPDDAAFPVRTFGPVTETNFSRYQRLGGKEQSWTDASSSIATTSFTFPLRSSAALAYEAGLPNALRLRAVDLAGNIGPEASVIITTDVVAPRPISLDDTWTSNGDRQATVFWLPSPSPDVAGHRVYYGSAPGGYDGVAAVQGPSPFSIGTVTFATLAGLTNGVPIFANVRPVDFAGNEGAFPSFFGRLIEVMLQPNAVSPTLIHAVSLSGKHNASALVTWGDGIVATATTWAGCFQPPVPGTTSLEIIDAGDLVSPVHGGAVQTSALGPTRLGEGLLLGDTLTDSIRPYHPHLALDLPYLYLAWANKLRVMSVVGEPEFVVFEMDLGAPATGLDVRGDKLFVASDDGQIRALDLSTLYDGIAATRPTVADVFGVVEDASTQGAGLTWTRDVLLQTENDPDNGGWLAHLFDLTEAVDGDDGTSWDATDRIGNAFPFGNPDGDLRTSGNYLYSTVGVFDIIDLAPLWRHEAQTGLLTPVGRALASGGGSSAPVEGTQAFLADGFGRTVRVLDVGDATAPRVASVYRTSVGGGLPLAFGAALEGTYLILPMVAGCAGAVQFLEVATPLSPKLALTVPGYTQRGVVSGGFLYDDGGAVIDLQATPPRELRGADPNCSVDAGARIDDVLVQASGGTLRVIDLSTVVDRDDGTPSPTPEILDPGPSRAITGVDAFGNFLVAAVRHDDGASSGTYLHVYDARKLRDGRTDTSLSLDDEVGAFQVTPATGLAGVTMFQDLALVTLDGSSAGLYLVKASPLFDDNDSAMGPAQQFGFLPTVNAQGDPSAAHSAAVWGDHAYVGTDDGLQIFDVTAARAFVPQPVPQNTARTRLDIGKVRALSVHGAYGYLSVVRGAGPGLNGSFHVVDLATPLAPAIVAGIPMDIALWDVCPGKFVRGGISVRGSRAYVSDAAGLFVLDLE